MSKPSGTPQLLRAAGVFMTAVADTHDHPDKAPIYIDTELAGVFILRAARIAEVSSIWLCRGDGVKASRD
jgi:hypothetical protein